jgi:4,5-dihydroxyphthalate decarboxylase
VISADADRYTQTTGMWVRTHLAEDYGLPIETMRWITRDGAHVREYVDPPIVEHVPIDKSLPDMPRDGDINAAILGNDLPKDDEFAPVIPDHAVGGQDLVFLSRLHED